MVVLEGTVVTGLESCGRGEVFEKLGVEAEQARGRIFFNVQNVTDAMKLRSIDNIHAVMSRDELRFSKESAADKKAMMNRVIEVDWEIGLRAWENAFKRELPGTIAKSLERLEAYRSSGVEAPPPGEGGDEVLPKFRVTCNRSGPKSRHSFTSQEMAGEIGHRIIQAFGWPVSMKEFDVEVIVNIEDGNDVVLFGLSLTKESLHKRNITHFGPTTLRSTLCYNMIRLCQPRTGDVICDPLCGGGSIPIEAALQWPQLTVLGGDSHPLGVERTKDNISALRDSGEPLSNLEVFNWDATELPLGKASLDGIVTDLPFGKKMGNHTVNQRLYPRFLNEWGRVVKPGGSVVALTQDKKNLLNALRYTSIFWKQKQIHHVNVGGLEATVIVLSRTAQE